MKNLISLSVLCVSVLSVGCNSSSDDNIYEYDDNPRDEVILVSGQSNAAYCDWSYFEDISGYRVKDISRPGYTIQMLIDDFYDNQPISEIYNKMIFVHGERDSILETDPDEYISKLHEYQNVLGVNKIYFSTVGYRNPAEKDWSFDKIRASVNNEALYNDSWIVGFNDAYTFRERDMLKDTVHFTEAGCKEMMYGMSMSIR